MLTKVTLIVTTSLISEECNPRKSSRGYLYWKTQNMKWTENFEFNFQQLDKTVVYYLTSDK